MKKKYLLFMMQCLFSHTQAANEMLPEKSMPSIPIINMCNYTHAC